MRTLSATLLAKQKSIQLDPLYKISLTRPGQTSYTYDRTRILAIDPHEEQSYSQKATVYLDNSDKALSGIDLKGYTAVISYGQQTSAGAEYSDCAPLTVIGQRFNSAPGELDCVLLMEGIPDLMADDRASQSYIPDDTDTTVVKDLLINIITATISCYGHCKPYDVVFDSEDSLIDSYMPKSSFRIYTNGSRLAAIRRLLDFTGCTMLVKADGKIHIFVPTTTGTSYDYEYSLASGEHTFLAKTYTKRLVIPNYVIVKSLDDDDPQYSGSATDPSYSLLEKREYHQMKLTSNDQATSIAQAVISKAQIQAEGGSGSVPINAGAEVLDYVKITDQRENDYRTGNIGYIRRRVIVKKRIWEMVFGFGGWASVKDLLKTLEVNSDAGQVFSRLSVKDLYAENIQTDNLDIAWIDPEGNIDLSQIGDNLDNLPDGEVYARVKAVHLDNGGLKIDDACIYKAGYDPSTKMPGDADLDDIPNGAVYSRVLATDISAGHIKLTSDTQVVGKWYDHSGVIIDATSGIILYGSDTAFRTRATAEGVDQCYMDSNGAICAGAGKVLLDANGLTIKDQLLRFFESATDTQVGIIGYDSANLYWLIGALGTGIDLVLSSNSGHVKCLVSPSENDDVATKKYVDDNAGSGGDMLKSTYDSDNDGKVDYAEAVYDGASYASASDLEDAVAKKHTQGTDTVLGSMSADIDMNSHRLTNLAAPRYSISGDSVRTTSKITEGNLENAIDLRHSQQHAINDTDDHTSTITAGKLIKADTNGLPAEADHSDDSFTAVSVHDYHLTRYLDTAYQNTSGKIKIISVSAKTSQSGGGSATSAPLLAYCDTNNPPTTLVGQAGGCYLEPTGTSYGYASITIVVPPNYYYKFSNAISIYAWME